MSRLLSSVLTLLALCGCGRPPPPPARPAAAIAAPASSPVVADISLAETDWPWWRGRQRDGIVDAPNIPTSWSESEHLLWKSPVLGRGHSSPIVCLGRVFLTTADEERQTQSVLAFDFRTGRKLWETIAHTGNFPKIHRKNSHASATPACDGARVFAPFLNGAALFVTATDLAGQILWQREVGPFVSEHGYGSSPVLFEGLVIVSGDSLGSGYLAALNRETGEIVWRTPRAGDHEHGNYSTPVVAELAGRPQLIHAGFHHVRSYDPATGAQLWQVSGPTLVMANTVAVKDPLVVVSGGFPDKEILGIRIDDVQNVTDANIIWRSHQNVSYVPSPLIDRDQVLMLSDNGTLASFNSADGVLVWQKRLPGKFSASPTLVGDLALVPNEDGETCVFRTRPDFEMISKNRLDDSGGMASPAICGGNILLRTDHWLYCVGNP